MKIGIIGLGKMGEALVRGLASQTSAHTIHATTRTEESAAKATARLGIRTHTDNLEVASECEVIIICVKPHHVQNVLMKMAPKLRAEQLIISIAASVMNDQIAEWSGGNVSIIRAMPNTPCLVGEGMTVFAPGARAGATQLKIAQTIFQAVGRTTVVDESLMDGVTGLSGCGPAYIYLIIEALSEAGVKVGLARETATLLASQTLLGAAKMVLTRGEHPAALKDEVTTPAGCTIDGLMALEEGKLRVTLIKAVLAATERSKTLRDSK